MRVTEAGLGSFAFYLDLFLKQQTYRCGVGNDGEDLERREDPKCRF